MLRSEVVKSYNSESLDDILVALQKNGCSISEVRSIELNTSQNNLSLKCNGFLILYDDPYVPIPDEEEEEEINEPDDEDLTNEQKFLRDWAIPPVHGKDDEYLCPAQVAKLLPSAYDASNSDYSSYDPTTGICTVTDPSKCEDCKEQFWKSKYKKPEKKEV